MKTGVICGTGPSLTRVVMDVCASAKLSGKAMIFGCNRTIFDLPLDVHHACNWQFWDHYGSELADFPVEMWTTRPEVPGKFPFVRYIREVWSPGLSRDPKTVHAHHGTGPQLINIAYHYGIERMLLVGWDMRHRGERHYFGEYPESMRHFTRNLGPEGELVGLIKEMETIIPSDYGIEIINCTPGSALTCFPFGRVEDYV